VEVDPVDNNAEGEVLLNFDVRRYLDGLRQYIWAVIAIVVLAVTAAVIYTSRQPRIYQAVASVQIEPRLPDVIGDRMDLFTRANVGGIDYYAQQQTVLGSYRLIRQTVAQHRLYTRLFTDEQRRDRKVDELIDWGTAAVQGMLSVSYPEQNRVMYVLVAGQDRQLTADIANAHIATYVDYSKGLLSTDTKQASGALSAEFDDAETKLREAESAMYQFQQDNDLLAVTLEERQSMVSSGITAYTNRLNEAHAARLELGAKLDRMRKAANEDVLQSPILLMGEHESFEALRAKYYEERNKFIELEKEIGPKNVQYQMQKAKIDDLYSALQSEAKRMLAGLEEQVQAAIATETALKAEVDRRTKEALELGPKVVAYNELLRRKKSMEDRYEILRGRLSSTDLSDRMNRNIDSSNVRPLDPALTPTVPVSPRLRVNVAIAGVLSLLLGLMLVFLIVFFDRSIKTTVDAQQAVGAPILGIIPVLNEPNLNDTDFARDLYVHENPTSRVAECCRSLRTNILFSAADRQLKTIVVSSANPREGKTTSVIYLGTTMAQSGQRVLLIDTDMRRPRLHVSTKVSRQTGLSNLIVGDTDYDSVIKQTEIPNLSVLPCGPLPPNPAELLMSNRFETVLAELAKRFDRIILDSPPLQVVTDAVVLSKLVDGVILVVHADKTIRDDIKRSARQIRAVQGKIFGVIVNAIEPDQRSGYYYSYYGYTEKSPEPTNPAS
jgi:polysaccharide biosynthesis transport protein